jgi:TonB family protein
MITALDIAIRSSAILLMGLALLPLLRRRSAAFRHWVLVATLLCAAATPLARFVMPSWEVVDLAPVLPSAIAERVVTVPTRLPAALSSPGLSPSSPPAVSPTAMVVGVWAAGVLLSLAMLSIGLLRLRRVHSRAVPVTTGPWTAGQPQAQVRVTDRAGTLLVWGLWRPTIIIPRAALTWTSSRVDAVLRHELAHVQRLDWSWLIAGEIVRAIYWFNPLVWITCARLRTECEIACDDAVIADGAAGADYATHVVAIAQELSNDHWLPAPAIVRPSTLERRVRAMLDLTRDRRPMSGRARGAAVVVVAAVSLAVAAAAAQSFVSLSGTIVDPTNGVLPGVKLVLVNEQTKAKYEIQTDRTGRYEFVGLPPGDYTIDAALPGFTRFSGRVTVATQHLQQDLTMSVGMLQETISVVLDAAPAVPDPERERRIQDIIEKRKAFKCPAEPPGGDVRMGGNIRTPVKLRDFRPSYPASQHGAEGQVLLKTQIGPDGRVDDIEVVSTTHPDFSQSAIDAVSRWEFDATLLNCEPIVTAMQVTVNYKLK